MKHPFVTDPPLVSSLSNHQTPDSVDSPCPFASQPMVYATGDTTSAKHSLTPLHAWVTGPPALLPSLHANASQVQFTIWSAIFEFSSLYQASNPQMIARSVGRPHRVGQGFTRSRSYGHFSFGGLASKTIPSITGVRQMSSGVALSYVVSWGVSWDTVKMTAERLRSKSNNATIPQLRL